MSRQSVASGLKLMVSPEALIPFIIGSLALAVAGNAVYQLLTNYFGTDYKAVTAIFFGTLLVLITVAWLLSSLVNRLRPASPVPNKKAPDKRKGLIVLVSNEPTIRKAIEWHNDTLLWCWLVCSEQSMPLASKIKADLEAQGRTAYLVLINDVLDPVECRNKVESIYTNLPPACTDSDVILDFTGMTVIASVGSVLACLDERRSIQYTPGVFNNELKAVQPRDPVEISLDWNMLRLPNSTTSNDATLPS